MAGFINLTGEVFGKLSVISRHGENTKGNKPQWLCICACGNQKVIPASYLRTGKVQSCGCDLYVDLTGRMFGKLLVIGKKETDCKEERYQWLCRCDCGSEPKAIRYSQLVYGNTVSCGCHRKSILDQSRLKHGLRYKREYKVWTGIKERCYNPNNKDYQVYGGRGIKMSEEWKNDFEAFYRDMGDAPTPEHTIDRKDNNLGYTKENCRWATRKEQANNKTNNLLFTIDGEVKTLSEWCDLHGIKLGTAATRIKRGMLPEYAVKFEKVDKNSIVSHAGNEYTISELCEMHGTNVNLFIKSIYCGMTISEALRVA